MKTLADLARLQKLPDMAEAKRQIGMLALLDQHRAFRERAAGNREWPGLSAVTVVLRKAGAKAGKIYDEKDIEERRRDVKILTDSNRLYASLTPSAPGNVLDVMPSAVRIGTNVGYARLHQQGGASAFRFGPDEERRLEKNVSKTLPGFRKPRALKSGKRRQWKKAGKPSPWNPFFFRLRGALRKMAGRSYRVPERPVVIPPRPEWQRKYLAVIHAAIRRIIRP